LLNLLTDIQAVAKYSKYLFSNCLFYQAIALDLQQSLINNHNMENVNKGADLSTAKSVLSLTIEDKPYEWEKQYITGKEIKKLGGLPPESELFLTISSPWKDEPIKDDEEVDIARPGIEGFYIKKKLKFFIDGKEFETDRQYILGAEIRKLGNIPTDYEIFLSIHGPFEDELIKDDTRVDLARPGIESFYGCKPNTTNG